MVTADFLALLRDDGCVLWVTFGCLLDRGKFLSHLTKYNNDCLLLKIKNENNDPTKYYFTYLSNLC